MVLIQLLLPITDTSGNHAMTALAGTRRELTMPDEERSTADWKP
jgi:hypothetical protein